MEVSSPGSVQWVSEAREGVTRVSCPATVCGVNSKDINGVKSTDSDISNVSASVLQAARRV